jgi:hypothetical protein
MRIFDGETTNTTSAAMPGQATRTVYCWGTFGGATVKVQISPDREEWFDVPELTFTEKGAVNASFQGSSLRGVISGGTGASINLEVV